MRRLAASLCLIMLLFWAGAFAFVKSHTESVAKQMGSVADQLEVPESWTEVSEHIEREQFICFNNKPCPSLSRTWQADRVLDAEDILQLAETAGWKFEIEGTCDRMVGAVGVSSVCSALATYDGQRIQLRLESPEPGAASVLRLYLDAPGAE